LCREVNDQPLRGNRGKGAAGRRGAGGMPAPGAAAGRVGGSGGRRTAGPAPAQQARVADPAGVSRRLIMRGAVTITLLLAMTSLSFAAPQGAGGGPPARFTITTRKADDTVTVGGDQERAVLDIKSPSGIGAAVIARTGDAWPKAVVVRLHL